mgnify:CR=1 FL=1
MGVFTAIYFQVNWGNFLGLILLGMLLLKGIEYNVNRKLIAYPFLKTRWILLIILIGLGFFKIYGDYTIKEYNTVSAGIAFSFR